MLLISLLVYIVLLKINYIGFKWATRLLSAALKTKTGFIMKRLTTALILLNMALPLVTLRGLTIRIKSPHPLILRLHRIKVYLQVQTHISRSQTLINRNCMSDSSSSKVVKKAAQFLGANRG